MGALSTATVETTAEDQCDSLGLSPFGKRIGVGVQVLLQVLDALAVTDSGDVSCITQAVEVTSGHRQVEGRDLTRHERRGELDAHYATFSKGVVAVLNVSSAMTRATFAT